MVYGKTERKLTPINSLRFLCALCVSAVHRALQIFTAEAQRTQRKRWEELNPLPTKSFIDRSPVNSLWFCYRWSNPSCDLLPTSHWPLL